MTETTTFDPDQSSLVLHARRELKAVGLYDDEDSDYGGELGQALEQTVTAFAKYGLSGGSVALSLDILPRLLRFEALTPLTTDPDEWFQHEEHLWQNRRQGSAFSTDGGKTYYDIEEAAPDGDPIIHHAKEHHA